MAALAISSLAANACVVSIRVACPSDSAAAGISVCIPGVGCGITDDLGITSINVPAFGSYNVCVDTTTLPAGATLKSACQKVNVSDPAPPMVSFTLGGTICSTNPPQGPCWLTGGGTIGKVKGNPQYTFGGVIYPGCSPSAAGGGNWNVVAHDAGIHFKGLTAIVDNCSGVNTRSPRVNVNIIDFHGDGIINGLDDNAADNVPVTFIGRATDNLESGGGSDTFYLAVYSGSTLVLQIGNSPTDPALITTGNLQIHTTSCK